MLLASGLDPATGGPDQRLLYEDARERIEKLAKQSGFEGRLVILAEPSIATGDCKIEWADGGVVLERAAIETKINELVGRYMASRGRPE